MTGHFPLRAPDGIEADGFVVVVSTVHNIVAVYGYVAGEGDAARARRFREEFTINPSHTFRTDPPIPGVAEQDQMFAAVALIELLKATVVEDTDAAARLVIGLTTILSRASLCAVLDVEPGGLLTLGVQELSGRTYAEVEAEVRATPVGQEITRRGARFPRGSKALH